MSFEQSLCSWEYKATFLSEMMFFLTIFIFVIVGVSGQETALLTGGFNGYEGGREGCELLNQACLIPSLPATSNTTGGSNRGDREDHITEVTEDGLVLACGGEAGDGTDGR